MMSDSQVSYLHLRFSPYFGTELHVVMRNFDCAMVPIGSFGWFGSSMLTLPHEKLVIVPDLFHMLLRISSAIIKQIIVMVVNAGFDEAGLSIARFLGTCAGKRASITWKKVGVKVSVCIKQCNHIGVTNVRSSRYFVSLIIVL